MSAEELKAATSELSDAELEAVAGGEACHTAFGMLLTY